MTLGDLITGGGQKTVDRLADLGSLIRYGVPFGEKARLAITGAIPGAQPQNMRSEAGGEIEQRRAAAYLFGRQWPTLAPEWQPIIDRMRSGDDPRVLAVTQDAVEQGSMDARRAKAAARAQMPALPPWLLEVK